MRKDSQKAVAEFMTATKKLLDTPQKMEDIYNAIVSRCPSATAYIYFDESGRPIKKTYEDFKNRVYTTSGKLAKLLSNIPAGTIVGLKLKNSPRWAEIFWALLMCGHSPLLIDAKLAKENADNLLSQARAKALIANDEEEFSVPTYRVNDVLNQESDYSFQPDWANHVIFCSSGTTGAAKMMVYTGKNLCAQIVASIEMPNKTVDLMYPGPIRNLAMLPFHHIFGFVAVYLWYTYYGKTIVYPSSMSTSDILYAVKKGKCTHVYSVPMLWDGVAQSVTRQAASMGPNKSDILSKLVAYNTNKITKKEAGWAANGFVKRVFQSKILGSQVRYCISGGGFLSPKTCALINGLGYPLYNGFGMTEVGITSVEMSPDVNRRIKCSIGQPFYGIEYKIGGDNVRIDDEGNMTGELLIKSDITHEREIIGGVLKRVGSEDGYFHTGDIATMDAQGNTYLKGRIKDTIILSNGENVFPDEIEYYFKDVKNLNHVVCLGAKRPGDSEEKITLVCEVDNTVSEESLKKIYADVKAINDTLPSEKKVQTILIDTKPLPLSGSMKVKRFLIKEAIEKGSNEFTGFEGPQREVVSFEGYEEKEVAEVVGRVIKVFSKVLLLPEFKIAADAIWTTDLGGDSMSYIEMAKRLDDEFKVEISEDLYGKLACANDFAKEILDLTHGKK
ncbi:MAG: AMP-binding protein [Bacilli bacterium]|nr:AMP-binding protein [Bacilli bacterium]